MISDLINNFKNEQKKILWNGCRCPHRHGTDAFTGLLCR